MGKNYEAPGFTYIPPTPERLAQATEILELSKQLEEPLAAACLPDAELDRFANGCSCALDHYDFLQDFHSIDMVRFRIQRLNGYLQTTAETSLLREWPIAPLNATQNTISAYKTTFDIGRQTMQCLGIPDGLPPIGYPRTDISDSVLYVSLTLPSLTTTSTAENSGFYSPFFWNIGADTPLQIYSSGQMMAEFSHRHGGIVIDTDAHDFLYPEWWSATLISANTPGKKYGQMVLNAIEGLERG